MHTKTRSVDAGAPEAIRARVLNATYSANTLRNYRSSWKGFQSWCRESGRDSIPATANDCIDHICWCLASGLRLETVDHRLKAVNHFHRQSGAPEPVNREVRAFLRKARRTVIEKPQGMHALTPEQLRRISRKLKNRGRYTDVRDRALLLLCFACGWRRSEIVSLDLEDIRWVEEGIVLWLGRSKTDQEARGRTVGIHFGQRALTCPIRALLEWLEIRGNDPGPLFLNSIEKRRLHPGAVYRAVKKGLSLIGETSTRFGAHSLRAGMVTAAVENGADLPAIMQRTGQRKLETVMRYVRPARAFRTDPLKGVL